MHNQNRISHNEVNTFDTLVYYDPFLSEFYFSYRQAKVRHVGLSTNFVAVYSGKMVLIGTIKVNYYSCTDHEKIYKFLNYFLF